MRSKVKFTELTPRQHQLALLMTEGRSNSYISKSLGIASETVKVYASHMYTKTGLNRVQIAVWTAAHVGNPYSVEVTGE